MLKRLPAFVEPVRYAEEGRSLIGEINIADMDRLKEYLSRPEATVRVSLEFGVDALKQKYLQGECHTELWMQCQRCLQDILEPVHAQFCLGLVTNEEQVELLSSVYDTLWDSHKPIKLSGILEDELILALPIVAHHPEGGCELVNPVADPQTGPVDEGDEKANPFAVLKRLNSTE